MNKIKKLSYYDIEKLIRINETWFTHDGLEMLYDYDGREHFEKLDREEAADLLEFRGIIKSSLKYPDGRFMIEWEDQEDPETSSGRWIREGSWEMFVQEFELSQTEAIKTAATHEWRRIILKNIKEAQEENRLRYAQTR